MQSNYEKMLRDAYEWWHYLTSKEENDRLAKKYFPEVKTVDGYPRFFMDTDKLRIYCLENGIDIPESAEKENNRLRDALEEILCKEGRQINQVYKIVHESLSPIWEREKALAKK
jgi:hypothetical protein